MNIGQIAKMAQQMQTQMAQAQDELKETTLEATAGGGTVNVTSANVETFIDGNAGRRTQQKEPVAALRRQVAVTFPLASSVASMTETTSSA